MQAGRFADATVAFQRVVELEPKNASAYDNLGVALMQTQRVDEALVAFEETLKKPADLDAIGTDGAEALGLAEHREHEAHVVGLAVVEQVAARRLARGQRRQELCDLLAGDHAMALRAPRLTLVAHAEALAMLGPRARTPGCLPALAPRAPTAP